MSKTLIIEFYYYKIFNCYNINLYGSILKKKINKFYIPMKDFIIKYSFIKNIFIASGSSSGINKLDINNTRDRGAEGGQLDKTNDLIHKAAIKNINELSIEQFKGDNLEKIIKKYLNFKNKSRINYKFKYIYNLLIKKIISKPERYPITKIKYQNKFDNLINKLYNKNTINKNIFKYIFTNEFIKYKINPTPLPIPGAKLTVNKLYILYNNYINYYLGYNKYISLKGGWPSFATVGGIGAPNKIKITKNPSLRADGLDKAPSRKDKIKIKGPRAGIDPRAGIGPRADIDGRLNRGALGRPGLALELGQGPNRRPHPASTLRKDLGAGDKIPALGRIKKSLLKINNIINISILKLIKNYEYRYIYEYKDNTNKI